jgi:hypothetical protein
LIAPRSKHVLAFVFKVIVALSCVLATASCTSLQLPLEQLFSPLGRDSYRTHEVHGYTHAYRLGVHTVRSSVSFRGGETRLRELRLRQSLSAAGWRLEIFEPDPSQPLLTTELQSSLLGLLVELDRWQRWAHHTSVRPSIKLVLVPPGSSVSLAKSEYQLSLDGIGMWFIAASMPAGASTEASEEWASSLGSLFAHELSHFSAWAVAPFRDDVEDEVAAYLAEVCFELKTTGRANLRRVKVADARAARLIDAGEVTKTKKMAEASGLHPTLAGVAVAQALIRQISPADVVSLGEGAADTLLALCRVAGRDRDEFSSRLHD